MSKFVFIDATSSAFVTDETATREQLISLEGSAAMSKAFKGIEMVRQITAEINAKTGSKISISTISAEPTVYRPGQFPIDRGRWEDELIRLFDVYAPDRDNSWREYGVDFENEIFWIHYDRQDLKCTCGVGDFGDDRHTRPCEYWWSSQPRFFHKPTEYGVTWYKYPCREAYGNQEKSIEDFHRIIDECIRSCGVS